jgi:hypothetical protein
MLVGSQSRGRMRRDQKVGEEEHDAGVDGLKFWCDQADDFLVEDVRS